MKCVQTLDRHTDMDIEAWTDRHGQRQTVDRQTDKQTRTDRWTDDPVRHNQYRHLNYTISIRIQCQLQVTF